MSERGPPDHVNGRGPPEHVRERFRRAKRTDNGIEVSDDSLKTLAEQVDWDNLSPFEEWVLALLNERGLLDR